MELLTLRKTMETVTEGVMYNQKHTVHAPIFSTYFLTKLRLQNIMKSELCLDK